jgi:hypothetical protein
MHRGVLRQLLAQLLHLGHGGGVDAIVLVLGFFVFEFLSHVGLLRGIARAECLLHLLRQAMLQVPVDLARAGVEDAVDTEVQLGAVNLENLAQLGDEFVVFAHVRLLKGLSGVLLELSSPGYQGAGSLRAEIAEYGRPNHCG